MVELLVDYFFYNLHNDWDQGDGPKISWVRWISGFKDWTDNRVFPLFGYIGIGDAGVYDVEQSATDRWKCSFQHANINPVCTTGG